MNCQYSDVIKTKYIASRCPELEDPGEFQRFPLKPSLIRIGKFGLLILQSQQVASVETHFGWNRYTYVVHIHV